MKPGGSSCHTYLLGAPVVVRNLAGQVLVRKGTGTGRRQETLPPRLGAGGVETETVPQVQPQQSLAAEQDTKLSIMAPTGLLH